MSEDVKEVVQEDVSDVEIFEPTPEYAANLAATDGEVREWEPTLEYAALLDAVDPADPDYWAQPNVGERKILSVDGGPDDWTIKLDDETAKIGGDLKEAILLSAKQFGPYKVAVDVYREKNVVCLAFSQGLFWKGANLTRHVTQIRINAAAELYGYLYNYGGKDRVQLLSTARSEGEKKAIQDATFIHNNRGYHYP